MEHSYQKRIRRIEKHLQFYLTENENYHLGLLFEDYLKSPYLVKYGLPKQFPENKSLIPTAVGSVTKVNQKGMFVRAQPEEKEVVIRHIDYRRKKDGVRLKYDREYNIYKKVLLHKFNSALNFVTNEHDQMLVVSEMMNYSSRDSLKGKHIANMFNEIFNGFEVFDQKLNPAIHFNTTFNQIILPSGKLDNQNNFDDLIEIGKRFTKNENAIKAYQKRLHVLKEYNPDIKGKGLNGFWGYLVFGFSDLDIIILETMYINNATYIFSTNNFEQLIIKDKQTVLNNKLHQARILHHVNWEASIRRFLDKLKK
jgi:hypothetical protein